MKRAYILALSMLSASALQTTLMTEYYPERTQTVLEQVLAYNCRTIMCGRVKIKPGVLHEVRAWFETLKNSQSDLLEAFALEGVHVESVFLEHASDGDYLIYYMRQDDIEKVYEKLAQHQMPIRMFHVECWKKFCDGCTVLEPLFDLSRQNGADKI